MSNLFLTEEQRRLDALKQRVENCTDCEFSQTRKNIVFGEGPLGGVVMSVSEAPGAEEDETGKPYQGRAGKYWERMLETAGLMRSSIYVCNSVCCRPPGNKMPDDYHNIHACNVHLLTQIAIIQPKLILAFGKVAAFALGVIRKSDSLSSVLGNYRTKFNDPFGYINYKSEQKEAELIVTYHPSYLMRGGLKQQEACWKSYIHLKEAREILDGLVIS
jgi:uracil-DNA glycosylase